MLKNLILTITILSNLTTGTSFAQSNRSNPQLSGCGILGLKQQVTPMGRVIDYKMVKKGLFKLQWGTKSNIRTYNETFDCDDAPVRFPKFEAEGKDYLLMRCGMGSGSWIGIFLPTDLNVAPIIIENYEAYDLLHNLVVFMDFDKKTNKSQIVIENLRSHKKQIVKTERECKSANPSYCITIVSVKNNVLRYYWDPEYGEGKKRIALTTVQVLI